MIIRNITGLLRLNIKTTKRSLSTKNFEDLSKKTFSLKDAWINPENKGITLPTYCVLDIDGKNIAHEEIPKDLQKEDIIKCYKGMVLLHVMDDFLNNLQRHGAITFYMPNTGEEAVHFGSASAIHPDDIIFAQYRECGVLMYRGFTVQDVINQCYSNRRDNGKGRQIPVHYGSKKLNFQTISSPLGTQIPQATGAGYVLKQRGLKNCVICYFGEGAASEGDFHPGLNFASTLDCATIFICRNNKWAISTPSKEQYCGDAIAGRGVAYGMHTIRVDGNDFFAVYNATREARRIVIEKGKPVLIEAMTYRVGAHSTSDDATRYRDTEKVDYWIKKNNPVYRLRNYIQHTKGWWTNEDDTALINDSKKQVLSAMKNAEKEKKPHLDHLFTDVYESLTPDLEIQKNEMYNNIRLYSSNYPIDSYSTEL